MNELGTVVGANKGDDVRIGLGIHIHTARDHIHAAPEAPAGP